MPAFDQPIFVTRPLLPDPALMQEAVAAIWQSGWLTNKGAQHEKLEALLREYLGLSQLSLFNNGTTALMIGLRALELQGEVITTPLTFPATSHVLTWNGLQPVFCDIDPQRLTLDPTRIEECINERTSAILGVHVYGIPCDVEAIERIAKRHGLAVIYDAAHAFSTTLDGRNIGTAGDLTMYSFHSTKLFHTAEGGALACRDAALREKVELLKNFGIRNEHEVVCTGINGKMNELQAAMGLLVLPMVEQEIQRRRAIGEVYRAAFAGVPGLELLQVPDGVIGSEQYFCMLIDDGVFGASRDEVYEQLRRDNVYARKYFHPLLNQVPSYAGLASAAASHLPVATRIGSRVLCLPYYGELGVDKAARIAELLLACRHSEWQAERRA